MTEPPDGWVGAPGRHHAMRIERYYNGLLGLSRPGANTPTIQEARKDLRDAIKARFPVSMG